MPVFRDTRVDTSGVEVRRGRGAVAMGGGLGGIGLLVVLVLQMLGGGGLPALQLPDDTQVAGTGEDAAEMQQRCNTDGAIDRYGDCFLVKVYNEINEIWQTELDGYRRPKLGFFEEAVSTGCGTASSQVGPFYCPPDEQIFLDVGFLVALQERFGAEGRYAQAYVLAHEVGHHLQTLLGIERDVRAAQRRSPRRANALSVEMELQADCYAGVWGRLADDRGNVAITDAELQEALSAAAAIGDDRIQERTQGRVDPESWTHGSAAQRSAAFRRGFRDARLDACPPPSI